MFRWSLVVVLALTTVAACDSSSSGGADTTAPAETTTGATVVVGDNRFEVPELGLTFSLADTFVAVDDPDYSFLAQSDVPRSFFSIAGEAEDVTGHEARPGETLSDAGLPDVDGVVVTDAALEGLPAGISANELLVSSGAQSFSVIMSAATGDLPELWDEFIRSVQVTPAG
ncbi:MAG: hypothetical protein RL238_516 [Actinomycetota bacterium]|jgi:hypothetical protein